MKKIFQKKWKMKKLQILFLFAIVIIQSCTTEENKIDTNNNGLGLNLASSSETSGVPSTP